ncbi:MAG: hypothetical protein AAF384_01360 [Pseudomonadota bacterium]
MSISKLIIAALISCLLFGSLFFSVLHKPLTIGIYADYFERKTAYLSKAQGKKVILLAGSNGRFSHRCESIEPIVGRPCANLSVTANLSLHYQFEKLKPWLKEGDLVYLPLEYGQLNRTRNDGAEVPFAVQYDKQALYGFAWRKRISALFYFDLPDLISSVGEMVLAQLGIGRRYSASDLTEQGDESGRTFERAKPYRDYIQNFTWAGPETGTVDPQSIGGRAVNDFLHWADEHSVLVVGGLPTTFDDEPISEEVVDEIGVFFSNRQHRFFALENLSQYPRDCFFDTQYHLLERCQLRHSEAVAKQLARIVKR